MAISDPFFSQGDIMRRLKALEDKLGQNSRSLEGSAIGEGGLTIYRNGAITVLDDDDTPVMKIGRLTDGSYGIEAIDANGNTMALSTLAFGLKSASQANGINANNGGNFGDYAGGSGPQVSGVTIGNTGRAVIRLTANLVGNGGTQGYMGCQIDGPTSVGATINRSLQLGTVGLAGSVIGMSCSYEYTIEGLLPGVYSFTAKYNGPNNTSFTFFDRTITVQPL